MKRRKIESGVKAREALARGAKTMRDIVGLTYGPFGENAFLDAKNKITNDGVTVAREVQLPDELENRGATAVREAAVKVVDEVGDGTTTAVLLMYAIYETLSKYLEKDGVRAKKRPSSLIEQLEEERKEITEKLIAMATPIKTQKQLVESARVATESEDLGKLIGEAQWQIGKSGYLQAEETAELESSVEIVRGIRIDNGFGTSQLINNQEKQTLDIQDAHVVLTSYTIQTLPDWKRIVELYDKVVKAGGSKLVVVARAWTEQTVNFCLQNINQGAMIYPISAPYVDMQERFKDLAAITGATFYDSESHDLSDLMASDLGFVEKVIARRYDAIVVGKNNPETKERVDARVKELEERHTGSNSAFEKKLLLERLGQLKNGFGIVKIGAASDTERQRLFDKAEDAVNAVRAAYQEGTVPGAGLAFKEISDTLPDSYLLKRPLRVLYDHIQSTAPEGFEIEEWVRDPVKVLRIALERACASAGAFASAGAVITEAFPSQIDEMFKTNAPQ